MQFNGMTNEWVKSLPAKELDHFLSTEILFMNKCRKNRQEYKPRQFSAQNCSEWKEASNCYRERRRIDSNYCLSISWEYNDFRATNFDISSSRLCDAQVKIFHTGSTETIFGISTNCSCWDLCQIPLQIVLEVLFIFNMIYVHWICFQTRGSLFFWVARVIKYTRRKPFEREGGPLNPSDRKCVLTEKNQAWP